MNYFCIGALTAFLKLYQCQPQPNRKTLPLWVQGIRIVPNCHNLAGFAIGTLHLAAMATLHLKALHKTKACPYKKGLHLLIF